LLSLVLRILKKNGRSCAILIRLPKNQLTLGEPILFSAKNAQDCILAAALASKIEDRDAIDTAVIEALKDQNTLKAYKQAKFVPFDPVSKRTEATVTDSQGKNVVVAKGATAGYR